MSANFLSRFQKKIGSLAKGFGSDHTIIPSNVVRSIPESCLDSAVKCHVIDMQVIRHADVESYHYTTDLPPAFRTEMHFARRNVYRLKDAMVHPHTGACSAGRHMFQESYGSLRRCLMEKPFPVSGAESVQLHGPATCIHATGYYHFLLEEVPRLLWTIDRYPDVKVYLADSAPQYCRDILGFLVERRIVQGYETIKTDLMVQMEEYVFTQAEAYSGFVHSADLSILIKSICGELSHVSMQKRKIYVSRKNAARSFDNETELEELLQNRGFDVVHSDNLAFSDQIALFRSAELIVAGHGAGLANLVWCQSETRVVEMFSPKHFNDCYARLCSSLQLNYQPMWARESDGWGIIDLARLQEAIGNV